MPNIKTLAALLLVAFVPLTVVGIAAATAPSGVTPAAHVEAATLAKGVKVNADGIKFKTKKPTAVSVLTLTVDPGGTTGWHSHPGFAVISVTNGTGTLYFADCSSRTVRSGKSFVETGDDPQTEFRNDTSSPVVLTVTFFAPKGEDIIRDEPRPACPRPAQTRGRMS